MKSTNIPEVKLGIVAVSRDCFPIQLSEKRRAAIVAACQAKGLDLYEAKTTVENEKDMEKAVAEVTEAQSSSTAPACLLQLLKATVTWSTAAAMLTAAC